MEKNLKCMDCGLKITPGIPYTKYRCFDINTGDYEGIEIRCFECTKLDKSRCDEVITLNKDNEFAKWLKLTGA